MPRPCDVGRRGVAWPSLDLAAASGQYLAQHYIARGAPLMGVGTDLHLLIASADALAQRWRDG